MYCEYFGLKEPPFSIAPNPAYLYMSQRHQDALAHLLYGIQSEGGFMLLTGEVGTGKTTLCRCLLEQIPDNTNVAFILNPFLGTNELLQAICKELSIDYSDNNASLRQLTELIYRYLLKNHSQGRNTVLIIDEAQHLQFKTLELIRLLTNLETNTKKLLQIIFIGQPELNRLLAQSKLRQLSQRITARFHIPPLSIDETIAYIRYRLKVGGLPGNQEIFPDAIIKRIHKMTGGIPRLINVLCDRALLGTFVQSKYKVDKPTLDKAISEVQGETEKKPFPYRLVAIGAAGLLLWSGLVWLIVSPSEATKAVDATVDTAQLPVLTKSDITENKTGVETIIAKGKLETELADSFQSASIADVAFSDKNTALRVLFKKTYAQTFSKTKPCQKAKLEGLACQTQTVSSWKELKQLNRPAILMLSNNKNESLYLPLSNIVGGRGLVVDKKGELKSIALLTIGDRWSGEMTFLWRPPTDYKGSLKQGDKGLTVAWLAEAFSIIDNEETRLAERNFTRALASRVKILQKKYELKEDGIVNLMTLLRLNEELGRDVVLVKTDAAEPSTDIGEAN